VPTNEYGSLTKEMPLSKVDGTIQAITRGMEYVELLRFARGSTQKDIPGLIRKRFLLVDDTGHVVYDEFLSLIERRGIGSPSVRKAMLFVWAYRDDRVRNFIIERVANANGRWNSNNLKNKRNADFFRRWGGAKARSNIEYFLVEAGIYDERTRRTHLELDDGWLEDAARVAAQHEDVPETRRQLVTNPYRFLAQRDWQALANATIEELNSRDPKVIFDIEPDEDEEIDSRKPAKSRIWARSEPSASDQTSTEAIINLVARERANKTHFAIEKALVDRIKHLGYEPRDNTNIDVFFQTESGTVIIEVKSCNETNVHAQIRKAVSQILEYRFVYSDDLAHPIYPAIAIECAPGPKKSWLLDYLTTLGITVAWFDAKNGKFVASGEVPNALAGIFDLPPKTPGIPVTKASDAIVPVERRAS
jgi:hypothetical protein